MPHRQASRRPRWEYSHRKNRQKGHQGPSPAFPPSREDVLTTSGVFTFEESSVYPVSASRPCIGVTEGLHLRFLIRLHRLSRLRAVLPDHRAEVAGVQPGEARVFTPLPPGRTAIQRSHEGQNLLRNLQGGHAHDFSSGSL